VQVLAGRGAEHDFGRVLDRIDLQPALLESVGHVLVAA
jgi:hypothetical protein